VSEAPETPELPKTPETDPIPEADRRESAAGREALAFVAAVAGWVVPGLGHLILRKWGRALVFFGSVAALALVGLYMRGNVFKPDTGDIFGTLGFLADAGSGVFYFVSHSLQKAGPDISRAAGDYGTRMFAAAGVLNLLCVLDAHEIAQGRKG